MTHAVFSGGPAAHDLMVYAATQFDCVQGVNRGEALSVLDDLCLGDSYRIGPMVEGRRLSLVGPDPARHQTQHYRTRSDDHEIRAELCLSVVTQTGKSGRIRLLEGDGRIWLFPLDDLDLTQSQTVIAVDPISEPLPLADPACLAFARGTRITLQDGSLKRVEDLTPDDRLLTRDGRGTALLATLRQSCAATGRNTRIVIREGAFANDHELVVSAAHKLFVPARRNDLAPNGADRMEPAFKLVNGLTITADRGGMAEYYHIILKKHEIIYAEGIPCESFLLDESARAGLTPDLTAQLGPLSADLCHSPNPLSLRPEERLSPAAPTQDHATRPRQSLKL